MFFRRRAPMMRDPRPLRTCPMYQTTPARSKAGSRDWRRNRVTSVRYREGEFPAMRTILPTPLTHNHQAICPKPLCGNGLAGASQLPRPLACRLLPKGYEREAPRSRPVPSRAWSTRNDGSSNHRSADEEVGHADAPHPGADRHRDLPRAADLRRRLARTGPSAAPACG